MPMIWTNEQQNYIHGTRDAFNRNEQRIADMYGNALVGNASPLPKYAWETIDRQSVPIQRDILAVFSDISASYNKPVPIGPLVHYFQTVSDSGGPANVSLDGRGKGKADNAVYDYKGTPLPIIDDEARYGWRQLAAAQQAGFGAFTQDGIDNSVRVVSEKIEDIMLNGDSTIVVGGQTLYGLRNHPQRNTGTHGLDLNGASGANWNTALVKIATALHGDNFYGNIKVYLNYNDWFYASVTDYNPTYGTKSILQRMTELTGFKFVPSSKVPVNELIGVADQVGVLNVLNGMPLSTRPKNRQDPEQDYVFTTMAATALEIRYDAKGQCGVAHITKA